MKDTVIAAYASLGSLRNLLDDVYDRIEIQYPPLDAQPFDALRDSVDFFVRKLEAHPEIKSEKLTKLWWEIATVSHEADDIIDAHVVDLLHQEERYMGHSTFSEQMERVNQTLHKIKADLLIAIEEGDGGQGKEEEGEGIDVKERDEANEEESADIQKEDKEGGNTQGENVQALKRRRVSSSAAHASSATSSHTKDDSVVGLHDKVIEIMDQLTSNEDDRRIITITGMGGIGKTTLAKTVYDAPSISQHFDVRLWVVVSQEYVVDDVIQRLLDSGEKKIFSCVEAREKHRDCERLSDLGVKLYQGLIGRRYLVVTDDVWSREVWDDLHWFFPRDGNGSRILMTTRNSIVASSLSSASNINRMDFLNIDNSWKLLCQKAFPQGNDPIPELEEAGKNIARGCKGLPLSIVVIGSMLASSPKMREYWESVAKDVNYFRNLRDRDGHCLKVLYLSFNNLPIHLKACFLYMFRISKYSQIDQGELIRAWIAWGLIHPVQQQGSKESVAKEYFRTLVGRNLILIHEYYANGEVSSCGLHDLLIDLCRREYEKNQFISSPIQHEIPAIAKQKACVLCRKQCGDKEEFRSFCSLVVINPSLSQVSPFMCKACAIRYRHIKRLSLVKVMDIVGEYTTSQELVHPTILQDLIIEIPNDLKFVSPSFAHLLWRLHSLYISESNSRTTPIVLPSEIWRMPQLKLISITEAVLTYPFGTNMEGSSFIILKNLYGLEKIRKFRCTPEVVRRIPNLRELSICDDDDSDSWVDNSLCNLAMFQKLERLHVDMPICTSSSENISFPKTLKLLVLRNTRIPWEDMTMVGSLPNLEMLQLEENAFIGHTWNPTEGEFLRLKALAIESNDDLLYLNAEATHFPKLESLYLRGIHQDLGIPDGIGDTPTLKIIQLECCGEYVINSAKQISKEQREDYGNEDLYVNIKDKDGRVYIFGGGR